MVSRMNPDIASCVLPVRHNEKLVVGGIGNRAMKARSSSALMRPSSGAGGGLGVGIIDGCICASL